MAITKPDTPVVFISVANDRTDTGFLRQLNRELKEIIGVLEPAFQADRLTLKIVPAAMREDITDVFQDFWYEKRIAIFHYGGHAEEDQLWLQDATGGNKAFFVDGLTGFLGAQEGIKLVFLNACATLKQAEKLIEDGIPAVIATSRKVGDNMAREFSQDFYRGISSGASIDQAFAEAEAIQLGNLGPVTFMKQDASRGVFWEETDANDPMEFPWRLITKPSVVEDHGDWRLFYEEKKESEIGQVKPESFLEQIINNTYRLEQVLGSGSLGTVFRAKHITLNEDRAIKITHRVLAGYEQLKQILLAGVKGLGAIQHPNIARTYDAGEVQLFGEKRLFMVMEYVTGDRLDKIDFKSILYTRSQLKTFLDFTLELCGGFVAAHDTRYEDANGMSREGIVHGNVKTRKILFNEEGIPKIIDFLFTDLTRSAEIKLEVPIEVQEKRAEEIPEDYFPPEVVSGQSGVNKLTDIYGMGAIFFEVVSGNRLSEVSFQNEGELHSLIQKRVSFFPTELTAIIFKALQARPSDRYLATSDMMQDILAYSSITTKIWYNFLKKFWYRFRKK